MKRLLGLLLFVFFSTSPAWATKITVPQQTVTNWQRTTDAPTIRVFANQTFTTSTNEIIQRGSPDDGQYYLSITCSIVGSTVTIPTFVIDSTTDGRDIRTTRYTFYWYDSAGNLLVPVDGMSGVQVPNVLASSSGCSPAGTCGIFSDIRVYNAGSPRLDRTDFYDKFQVDQKVLALNPTTTKGDLLTHNGSSSVRLPVGTDNQVLIADSTQSLGLRWGTGGGGVPSVFGRTGAVVATTNDYTWAQIDKSLASLADIPTRSATDLTSGTLPDARFPATLPILSGVNLTNLNASNLASGTVPLGRLSGITNTEISASAGIVDTKLATISTAGKVSDSALSSNVLFNTSSLDFSKVTSASIEEDRSGRYFLRSLQSKFGKIFNGTNAVANIVWLGDSITMQEFILRPLRDDLRSEYGNAGPGFVRATSDAVNAPYLTIVNTTGSWAERDQSASALGVYANDATSTDTVTPASKTWSGQDLFFTDAKIHYIKQSGGGSFRYKVDSGSWTTVSTANATTIFATETVASVAYGLHTFTVEITVGGTGVTLLGVDFTSAVKGVKVHNLGNTGSMASEFAAQNATIWQNGLAALNPDVVVLPWGQNEANNGQSVSTYTTSLSTLISRIHTAAPLADILIVGPYDKGAGTTFPMIDYNVGAHTVARTQGVGWVDWYKILGTWADANSRGLFNDSAHVSAEGGRSLEEPTYAYINPPSKSVFRGGTFIGPITFDYNSSANGGGVLLPDATNSTTIGSLSNYGNSVGLKLTASGNGFAFVKSNGATGAVMNTGGTWVFGPGNDRSATINMTPWSNGAAGMIIEETSGQTGSSLRVLNSSAVPGFTVLYNRLRILNTAAALDENTNYERLSISPVSNVYTFASEAGGTGTARNFAFTGGDVTISGLLKAGSTPTTLTDASGKILSSALNTVALAQGGTGSSLTDPAANKIVAWDDTDNTIQFWTLGSGLNYDHTTHTLSAPTGGSGTVTNTGTLTAGQLIKGNGGADITVGNLTGDVTTSGSMATTIAAGAVTYSKIQNVSATSRFLGRITAGAGSTEELTGTQATTLLDTFTSTLKGLVPSSGGGTTNFLRADGTWAAPSGGGGGSPGGSGTEIQYRGGASTFSAVTSSSVSGGQVTWADKQTITLDNATTAVADPLLDIQHSSSGTVANGFGSQIRFGLESSTTVNRDAGAIGVSWSDVTDLTRTSYMSFYGVYNGGAMEEVGRVGVAPTVSWNRGFQDMSGGTARNYYGGSGNDALIYSPNAALHFTNGFGAGLLLVYGRDDLNLDSSISIGGTGGVYVYNGDTGTSNVSTEFGLKRNISGTPAAGFGSAIKYTLKSSTTNDRDAARITASWTTATDASRTSKLAIETVDNAGSLTEWFSIAGNGQTTHTLLDAATTIPTDLLILQHNTTGTVGKEFGTGILFQNQTSTTQNRDTGKIVAGWTDQADATRTSEIRFFTVSGGGSLTERAWFNANGLAFGTDAFITLSEHSSAPSTPAVGANALYTKSDDRLYLKDGTGTETKFVGIATTDTLTNKTLTSPVISTISNTGTLTLPTSTDTLVGRATTDTLTNKTVDPEGTGNVIGFLGKIWIDAAGGTAAAPASNWDLPATNTPVVAVIEGGTNGVLQGVLDFADGATDLTAQRTWLLPSDWTGAVDVKFRWFSSVTTGDVIWGVATACVADAETNDPTFNTYSAVTDTTKGTANQLNDASVTGITTTGCAAGETMHLKIARRLSQAGDTMAGTARLTGIEITYRRNQ